VIGRWLSAAKEVVMLSFAPNATKYFTPKELLEAGSSVGRLDQQRRHDMATFASEDVVGPASGQCIHGFYANSLFHQAAQKSGWRKAQARPTAEKDQFWVVAGELLKVLSMEVFKACAIPLYQLPTGTDDDAAFNFFAQAVSA